MQRAARSLHFIPPMECKPVTALPSGEQWQYELKLDGYRVQAIKNNREVRLFSRNGNAFEHRYPGIAEAVRLLRADEFIIDGEIVAVDAQGGHSFSTLQKVNGPSSAHLRYYAFDLLTLEGKELTKLPLARRRQLLQAKVPMPAGSLVQPGPVFQGEPDHIVAKIREFGFEGVVAKRLDSRYEPGERTGAWVKMRTNLRQEFVVGGYIPGARTFDALLVGVFIKKRLHFVAKVRNGFVPRTRNAIFPRLKKLRADACPFVNLPEEKRGRWGDSITAEKMQECRWIKPRLVCEIAFVEWTDAGHLRHCNFVAMRDDKLASNVVREA